MAKGLAPILFTASGVVVAGVMGYGFLQSQEGRLVAPIVSSETKGNVENSTMQKLEESQEVAKLDDGKIVSIPKLADETKKQPKSNGKPEFDIIRVEPDGSAVIAGRALANQKIELLDGENAIAESKTNSTGEFAFVLEEPLAPGSHELSLRATSKDGAVERSSSFTFVDIQKTNVGGGATVLLAEQGKASKVLQKPDLSTVATGTSQTEETQKTEVASVESKAEEEQEEVTVEVTKEVSDEETSIAKPEIKAATVLIEAADVEVGKIFIAGTGEPNTTINLYLDNDLLGSVMVDSNGAFLFEGTKDINAGRYDIRADMIKKGSQDVIARAEVSLVHEPKVALVKEPEQLEVKEEEPIKKVEPVAETKSEQELVTTKLETTEPEKTEPKFVESTPTKDDEPKQEASVEIGLPQDGPQTDTAKIEETTNKDSVEEPAVETKKEIRTGSAVIIRRGDSLWTVARRNYGAGVRYTTIFDANRDQVRNPSLIYPGQILKVPEEQETTQ